MDWPDCEGAVPDPGLDEERAMETLPELFFDNPRARTVAFKAVGRVVEARGTLSDEARGRLAQMKILFGAPEDERAGAAGRIGG
jgi:hypothetical protein